MEAAIFILLIFVISDVMYLINPDNLLVKASRLVKKFKRTVKILFYEYKKENNRRVVRISEEERFFYEYKPQISGDSSAQKDAA